MGYVTTPWDDGEGEPSGLAEVLDDAEAFYCQQAAVKRSVSDFEGRPRQCAVVR